MAVCMHLKKNYRRCHVDGVKRKCGGVCSVDGENAKENKFVIYRCPVLEAGKKADLKNQTLMPYRK